MIRLFKRKEEEKKEEKKVEKEAKEKIEKKKEKKKEEKVEEKKKREKKEEQKEVSEKEIKKEFPGLKKEKAKTEVLDAIIAPHITEKATLLEGQQKYVFKVRKKANKSEIKKAIEALYGVHVVSVRIVNIPPKKRRLGRIEGRRKGYKKAIVKIREGEKIQILSR